MAIMRALGDSIHPLYYLVLSSIVNVLLDLLFVAVLGYGVAGAGVATVIAQGISAVMCIVKMCRTDGVGRLKLRALRYYPEYMGEVIVQGFRTESRTRLSVSETWLSRPTSIHLARMRCRVWGHTAK